MAGKGTISVNQAPQYGDKTALESAAKATTTTPMTGNVTPARGAGRPSGGGGPSPTQIPPEQPIGGVPTAHREAAAEVARKAWAAKVWAELAARPDAGPRTKLYAQVAQRGLQAAMLNARNRTPFFE